MASTTERSTVAPKLSDKILEQNALLEAKDRLLETQRQEIQELRDRVLSLENQPVESKGYKVGDLVNLDGTECVISGERVTRHYYMVTNLLTRVSVQAKETELTLLDDLKWHACSIREARDFLAIGKRVVHPNSKNDKSLWYELGHNGHIYHVGRSGYRKDIEGNLRMFFSGKGTWFWSEKIR